MTGGVLLALLARCTARRESDVDFFLVKVGKTAGSTVAEFLEANGVMCKQVHLKPLMPRDFQSSTRFIITARDPLARVVSAHKYCNPDGGGEPFTAGKTHVLGRSRRAFYGCFPNVTAFARAFLDPAGDPPPTLQPLQKAKSMADLAAALPAANDSTAERMRKCRWLAEEALEPQALPQKHISQGFRWYMGAVLPLLERKRVYVVRGGAQTATDLLALGAFLNMTLRSNTVPNFNNAAYPRSKERIEDRSAEAALRRRLQFEYDFLAKIAALSTPSERSK